MSSSSSRTNLSKYSSCQSGPFLYLLRCMRCEVNDFSEWTIEESS